MHRLFQSFHCIQYAAIFINISLLPLNVIQSFTSTSQTTFLQNTRLSNSPNIKITGLSAIVYPIQEKDDDPLTLTSNEKKENSKIKENHDITTKNKNSNINRYYFSVPIINARPKPSNVLETLNELWNDPRPISSVLSSKTDRSNVGSMQINDINGYDSEYNATDTTQTISIPYCLISDEFKIENHAFQILVYPKGRFVAGETGKDSIQSFKQGPASAYLRYLPKNYGDEVDIAWKLRLIKESDEQSFQSLTIATSGGLPKSKDTWSAAMTFCTENEALESVGRATDWGSSSWLAQEVCDAYASSVSNVLNGMMSGELRAEGTITVFGSRTDETSFAWPIGSKGAIGAIRQSISPFRNQSNQLENKTEYNRPFRVGEVVVPVMKDSMITFHKKEESNDNVRSEDTKEDILTSKGIFPGVDYRIMTMTDQNGKEIFSTSHLSNEESKHVRLALRPCGLKTQQSVVSTMKKNQNASKQQQQQQYSYWPVEIEAGLLSTPQKSLKSSNYYALSRFDPRASLPRIKSAFQRDAIAYLAAIALAISPIPLTLLARNVVSLYAIPSASMEPTLMRGDVLLVEKLPNVMDRTHRGDVILFQPSDTLNDIIYQTGGGNNQRIGGWNRPNSAISSTSLFVKRIVGLPGDTNIKMDNKEEVTIQNQRAVGPNRNLCDDEPLRLISRLLDTYGYGKDIQELGPNDVYVLGDCKDVSVDSRVFGALPKQNIVGKPLARLWPLNRLSLGPF